MHSRLESHPVVRMADTENRRFDGLQVLRGLAVLLVIWTHIKHTADFSQLAWIENHVGNVGVDIFFVISGFVISVSALSLNFSALPFLVNRFSRIAPLFWLTSLPLIGVALLKDPEAAWRGAVTTFTFLPLFDFDAFTPPTNNFGWTLCFEFWFYLAFGLMLRLYGRNAWIALLGFFAIGTAAVHYFYQGRYYLPIFLFGPMVYEFMAGVLIYRMRHSFGLISALLALCCAMVLMACLISGQVVFGDFMGDYTAGFLRVFFRGGVGIALVVMFVGLDNWRRIAWPKWALLIGNCSYSIYLMQAYALWAAINLGRSLHLPAWLSGSTFVVLCLLLGIVVSLSVENNTTRVVRQALNRFWRIDRRNARPQVRALAS